MPLHHSSGLDPSLEHTEQPRCHGMHFALGYYLGTMGDHIPVTISNQVTSPAGFHRRMDRSTNARTPKLVELMDNIRRQLQVSFESRSRSGPSITTGGQDALRLAHAICKPLE
jgi:hypothetical protein